VHATNFTNGQSRRTHPDVRSSPTAGIVYLKHIEPEPWSTKAARGVSREGAFVGSKLPSRREGEPKSFMNDNVEMCTGS